MTTTRRAGMGAALAAALGVVLHADAAGREVRRFRVELFGPDNAAALSRWAHLERFGTPFASVVATAISNNQECGDRPTRLLLYFAGDVRDLRDAIDALGLRAGEDYAIHRLP